MVEINNEKSHFVDKIGELYDKYKDDNSQDEVSIDDFLQYYKQISNLKSDYDSLKYELEELTLLYDDLSEKNSELEELLYKSNENHQLLLEKYRLILKNNHKLSKTNIDSENENDELKKIVKSYETQLKESKELINKLNDEKQYYVNNLDKLSLIINLLNEQQFDCLNNLDIKSNIEYSSYYKLLENSEYFDKEWYARTYLQDNKIDPVKHYLSIGYTLNYNPNPNFDSEYYTSTYFDVKNKNLIPLVDYLLRGKDEGRQVVPPKETPSTIKDTWDYRIVDESSVFDKEWYKIEYNLEEDSDATLHYITTGVIRDFKPSETFDAEWYKREYNVQGNPLVDYMSHPERFTQKQELYNKPEPINMEDTQEYMLIKEHGLLDEEYYENEYFISPKYDDIIVQFIEFGFYNEFNLSNLLETDTTKSLHEFVVEAVAEKLANKNFDYSTDYEYTIKDSREYNIILEEGLFDEEYYNIINFDVRNAGVDALTHYLSFGYMEGRNPNKNFDNEGYYKVNPGIRGKENPLLHYIYHNKKTNYITSKEEAATTKDTQEYNIIKNSDYFDEEYYFDQKPELKSLEIDPAEHFLNYGVFEGLNPNRDFDLDKFKQQYKIQYSKLNPLIYYIFTSTNPSFKKDDLIVHKPVYKTYSQKDYDTLRNSELFDNEFYVKHNPNITADEDPIEHFLKHALEESYPTSKYFDTKWYINAYPDVKEANLNPLLHYIYSGEIENRKKRRARLSMDEIVQITGDEEIKEVYDVIYDSLLFDEEYYVNHNPIANIDDMDLVLHYILYGVELGFNPSQSFSTSKYLKLYTDIASACINPLYHFIETGSEEFRKIFSVEEDLVDYFDKLKSKVRSKDIYNILHEKVSIIIPIYNAYEETVQCIRSVLLNTSLDYELILIDDCSPDERIDELLSFVEDIPQVKVVRNKENQGFVKNVNLGMSITENDVVLLNSDTIVTPRWLSHLVVSAYTADDIATVTPFCNSSDISIEELGTDNDQLFLNKNAYQINKLSNLKYHTSPTGNGFCLYIKREVIDEIGFFDESFGMGYGEETDFTSRAVEAGYRNIRNDAVFVYHRRHASFSKDKSNKLKEENKKILSEKHPNVFKDWEVFANSVELNRSIEKIRQSIKPYHNSERILYVTNVEDNLPNLDEKFYSISNKYDTYVLTITEEEIELLAYHNKRLSTIKFWETNPLWVIDDYFTLYFNILAHLKIDLVYIRDFEEYYQPYLQDETSFISILPYLEIKALYEATTQEDNLTDLIENKLNPLMSLEEITEEKESNINWDKKKVVVYTALTGFYDDLTTPTVIDENFDYICFTDNPEIKSEFWEIRYMEDLDLDEIRKARKYKLLPHKYLKEYDYSIWIDANFDIIGDIKHYINNNSRKNKILTIKHYANNCIYKEAQCYIENKKCDKEVIQEQIQKYKEEKYPENNGLQATGVIFRDHNDSHIIKIDEDWYNEVENHCSNDQLSFNYICWKNNYSFEESRLYYYKNEYFQILHHDDSKHYRLPFDEETTQDILDSFNEKTTILVPVYNAYEETIECIESIKKYTTIPYDLLLINDCSPDERIKPLLDSYVDENIRVIHNKTNQGFVRNVNIGFEHSENDVVLLNSDTEVTPKWLQKLKIRAYSEEKISSVTPVSNNAGAFSVPIIDQENKIKEELGVLDTANILEKSDDNKYIDTPTGNGFCMYIKRGAIHSAGFFDTKFGKGYCEENDFSMRLLNRGWKNVIDTSTYIYHKGSVSFSQEKEKLYNKNRQLLDELYPKYSNKVRLFVESTHYKRKREHFGRILESKQVQYFNSKRALYVTNQDVTDIQDLINELNHKLSENYEIYVLNSNYEELTLSRYTEYTDERVSDEFQKHLHILSKWTLDEEYSAKTTSIAQFRMLYFNVLYTLKIDEINIDHLIGHTFDLPDIAKRIGIPVSVKLQDYYYICPSRNLIDDHDTFCGGYCTAIEIPEEIEDMPQCDVEEELNLPILRTYVYKWRRNVKNMFKNVSTCKTVDEDIKSKYLEFYPEIELN